MSVSPSTYLEALLLLLGDNSDRSKALVKKFIEVTDKDSAKKDVFTTEDDLVVVYKSLIKSVITENITQDDQTTSKVLLLKIKTNETINQHPVIRDILTDILTAQEPITPNQIDEYSKRLRNVILQSEIDNSNRVIFAKIRVIPEIKDVDEQSAALEDIRSYLEKSLKVIEERQNLSDVKASETYVSLSDRESILRAIDTHMDRNVNGIIRTGLQGLNRALGERGGIGLGETTVFAAPSHNYKTGMLVSFIIWTVVCNTFDKIIKPGFTGLLYFVSLENEVSQNVMDVFKALYGRVERKKVDQTTMSSEFIMDWLHSFFAKYNITVYIDRYTPHEFSFKKFLGRYNGFVEQGYQVIVFDLDYMSEARGLDPGDTMSAAGRMQMIGENYIKFANHAKQCAYSLVTGHQLNRSADEEGQRSRYAVKKFNPSMMAETSDVMRIIDILFFLKLENNVDNRKFLTAINRKNRYCKDTPESDKFFAYPFTEFGIEDDLNEMPQYVIDIDAWGDTKAATEEAIVEAAMF